MRYLNNKSLIVTALFLLTACTTPTTLTYHLDPEIAELDKLSPLAKVIAISVTDKRPAQTPSNNKNIIIINNNPDDAAILKEKLITQLKKNNFQIISNPLLADVSIAIQIEQLAIKILKSFLKSKISVRNQLRVTTYKQGQKLTKRYRMNRQQEIMNPPSERDITGIVNLLLSKQLSAILTDPSLIDRPRI